MSGGHWNYEDGQIGEMLNKVGTDGKVILRFPKLAQVYRDLGTVLYLINHEIDWDFSGDSQIEDDRKFEEWALKRIGEVLQKDFKVRVYEVEEKSK